MFMKAILHNKEDDLHFLLKCLVEELEDSLLLKKEDKSEEKKPLDDFEEADKKAKKAKKADNKVVEEENEKFRSYLVNTLGEKLTEKDIKAHNKMYNGFQNWVLGNQAAQRTIDALQGTKKTRGKINLQEEQIKQLKKVGVFRGREKNRKGGKLSDVIRPLEEGQYRPATEKEIKDAEKNLKVLKDMLKEANEKKKAPQKQYKDMLDKLKAGKDFYMKNGLGETIKLKNADVKRAIEQREQILFPPPKKVSYEEALETTDKDLLGKLKELLDDKDIKRALGEMVEISQRNIGLEADDAKKPMTPKQREAYEKEKGKEAINQAFIEDRPRGKEKSVKGSKQLEMYLRVIGLIETELAKLKRQAKPTTQKKIDALENKISDLETLFTSFRKKKNELGTSSNTEEDKAYRPNENTKTYYNRLQKALEKFKDNLKTTKKPEDRAISARKLFNTKELKNIETVMSVLDIIDNKEVAIDKLQVLREREGKLRELVESHKTPEVGTKYPTRKVAREANQKQKDYNKHIKELETTMMQIKDLAESKRTKEGRLPTREADPKNPPAKPSKQVKPMDDKKYREALSPNRLKKQDFEAYRRYDIDRNRKITVRTTPFDEGATYAKDIADAITKIRELLSTEIDGKTIEEELRSSLNYKKTDISREGKEKRKKLRDFIAGKKKKLQGKRKGKEQMKSTLSKTLVRQITYIEEDMSDSLMEALSRLFPNTTLKAELPNLTYIALPQKTPEEIKERKEKYFEKVNEDRMVEGKEKIEYSFKLGEKPKSTDKNQIKGEVRKYLKILPTLVEKGNLAKPTGEALAEIRESHIEIHTQLTDLIVEVAKEPNAKKRKEKLELKEKKELVLNRELVRIQNIFKVYENDIDDLLKVFKAIEEFVENYTKQRDEYIKIVEKIQAIRPQTYNKVKWSEIVEKPLPRRKTSVAGAKR